LNEPGGWDTGMMRIFYTLGQDFLYTDPYLNVIFVDNHDLVRFMTSIGEDPGKFKVGLAFILTTRGIPQIYYGTEIMMMGGDNDPDKRRLFPGGWPNDEINAFTDIGREQLGEQRNLPIPEVYDFVTTITQWRKNKEVIHSGELTHFIPENNVYVYFRHNEEDTVMVVLNGDDQAKEVNLARFGEFISEGDLGTDIFSGNEITFHSKLKINGYAVLIVDL
jgi:glycosidase